MMAMGLEKMSAMRLLERPDWSTLVLLHVSLSHLYYAITHTLMFRFPMGSISTNSSVLSP